MPVVFLRNDTFHIVYLDYVIFIGYNVAYQIGIMGVDGDQDTRFSANFQYVVAKMRLPSGLCPGPDPAGGLPAPPSW